VAVDVEIGTGPSRMRAVADDEGLRVESRGRTRKAPWETITGGGLVRPRNIEFEAMGPEAAKVLPGLARVAEASRRMTDAHQLLMLAETNTRGRRRIFLMPIPADDPNADDLVAEVKRRLGSRWQGEDWDLRALQKELGASYPRWYWPAGLLFALFIVAVSLPAIAAWGQLTEGDLSAMEPWWLVGLAVWLGFIALVFFLARGVVGTDHWRPWAMAAPVALLLAILAPTAIVTRRLAADWKFGELEPSMVVVLALWLGLATLFVSFLRRRSS
jgi:hypothetical protein